MLARGEDSEKLLPRAIRPLTTSNSTSYRPPAFPLTRVTFMGGEQFTVQDVRSGETTQLCRSAAGDIGLLCHDALTSCG